MVDPVQPISATAPSSPTRIGQSTSIGSEPENAWVAARQSAMTADLIGHAHRARPHPEEAAEEDIPGLPHRDPEHGAAEHHAEPSAEGDSSDAEAGQAPLLSGESPRIGTVNFEDDTPFGERTAII